MLETFRKALQSGRHKGLRDQDIEEQHKQQSTEIKFKVDKAMHPFKELAKLLKQASDEKSAFDFHYQGADREDSLRHLYRFTCGRRHDSDPERSCTIHASGRPRSEKVFLEINLDTTDRSFNYTITPNHSSPKLEKALAVILEWAGETAPDRVEEIERLITQRFDKEDLSDTFPVKD
jgi:hypothetical protein